MSWFIRIFIDSIIEVVCLNKKIMFVQNFKICYSLSLFFFQRIPRIGIFTDPTVVYLLQETNGKNK